MQNFEYINNLLHFDQVNLSNLARQFGTPCYVYSQATIEKNWDAFDQSFGDKPHRICYAVKANSNISLLQLLAKKHSGFDIVSRGELERVLQAGGDPKKIVFSGVGKQTHEIIRALNVGIHCFNVESEPELLQIHAIAEELHTIAPIALRINPNIDAKTHPYIATGLHENKFGISHEQVAPFIQKILSMPHLQLIGIACHIGSQLTDMDPFIDSIEKLSEIIDIIKSHHISLQHINIGGGLGVQYQNEIPPSIPDYIKTILQKLSPYPYEILIEPGRAIVADAGILLTTVEYLKHTTHKNFAIVDAAMNDFIRPALYDAWHEILPITKHPHLPHSTYDIVGPVCESGDFFGKSRLLAIQEKDILAICMAGAYGFSMSSHYNSRPKAAEILINHHEARIIRQRETIDDLLALEKGFLQ